MKQPKEESNMKPKNLTVYIDEITEELMKKYPEVKWSNVCQMAIKDYIKKREKSEAIVRL